MTSLSYQKYIFLMVAIILVKIIVDQTFVYVFNCCSLKIKISIFNYTKKNSIFKGKTFRAATLPGNQEKPGILETLKKKPGILNKDF